MLPWTSFSDPVMPCRLQQQGGGCSRDDAPRSTAQRSAAAAAPNVGSNPTPTSALGSHVSLRVPLPCTHLHSIGASGTWPGPGSARQPRLSRQRAPDDQPETRFYDFHFALTRLCCSASHQTELVGLLPLTGGQQPARADRATNRCHAVIFHHSSLSRLSSPASLQRIATTPPHFTRPRSHSTAQHSRSVEAVCPMRQPLHNCLDTPLGLSQPSHKSHCCISRRYHSTDRPTGVCSCLRATSPSSGTTRSASNLVVSAWLLCCGLDQPGQSCQPNTQVGFAAWRHPKSAPALESFLHLPAAARSPQPGNGIIAPQRAGSQPCSS